MKKYISTHDQILIAQLLLDLADTAVSHEDALTLAKLSLIASSLLPYADESDITIFFDLGEYLDERSQDIIQHRDPHGGWGERALESVQRSLAIARSMDSKRSDHAA